METAKKRTINSLAMIQQHIKNLGPGTTFKQVQILTNGWYQNIFKIGSKVNSHYARWRLLKNEVSLKQRLPMNPACKELFH
jgi:hypothetical protein